jgi:hypothetical protein
VLLDSAISAWEADGELMADVQVCVNNLARVRGGRVYVPSESASEFSLALTPALALVLEAASSPIQHSALVGKLAAEFPEADERRRAALVAELLRTRLLRTALRAAATVVDPADALPPGVLGTATGGRELWTCGWMPRCACRRRSRSSWRPWRPCWPGSQRIPPGPRRGAAISSSSPTALARPPRSVWSS